MEWRTIGFRVRAPYDSASSSTEGYLQLGSEGSGWTLIGARDFDGDGRSELYWRHTPSGSVASWRSRDGYTLLGAEGSGWTIFDTPAP